VPEVQRPVVWISYKDERCASCGKAIERRGFIVMDRAKGIRCLACEGLDGLEFLGSGDAAVTRRALARSRRSAIVVKFSRARHRNERQGVLVEPNAIEDASVESEKDAAAREMAKGKRRIRDVAKEAGYVEVFAATIRRVFPSVPLREADQITARACEKYSGRVGRTAAAKAFDEGTVHLAVRAHVRHAHTDYDRLLADGLSPSDARAEVRGTIEAVLDRWRRA
jgi:hypothetical protein